jgi:hypothetical protein
MKKAIKTKLQYKRIYEETQGPAGSRGRFFLMDATRFKWFELPLDINLLPTEEILNHLILSYRKDEREYGIKTDIRVRKLCGVIYLRISGEVSFTVNGEVHPYKKWFAIA